MSTKINFMAIAIVGIIVGTAGVGIWYYTVVQSEYDKKDQIIAQLEQDNQDLLKVQEITESIPSNTAGISNSDLPPGDSPLPIYTFEPTGGFTPEEKDEIETKLVEPYFLYFNETSLQAVTMNISTGFGTSWGVFVTNIDGSYSSFLYGNKNLADQEWWNPECFGSCNFSNTFRGAYPQIVNLNTGL